jgi:hypothetical protein
MALHCCQSAKMAGVLNTSMSYEQRNVIRFLGSKGRTPTEIHREMQPTYGDKCLALRSVRWWCCEFINGQEDLNDNERSGRPRASLTSDNRPNSTTAASPNLWCNGTNAWTGVVTMWKNSQRYLEHCLYFDFPICILLWLKKNRGKDFSIYMF